MPPHTKSSSLCAALCTHADPLSACVCGVSSAAQVAQSSERSGPQGREARSGAADAEVFAHVSSAHAARPPARAGALLPNLRWPEGAALSLLTA
eukprot:3118950-Prymnesium_polylepis.1